ncbi:MAG: ABC transporter substrate-binding protein [Thermodesulfobacteriota bacterium]
MVRVGRTLAAAVVVFLLIVEPALAAGVEKKPVFRVGYLPLLPQLPLVVSYENDRYALKKFQLELVKWNSFTSAEAAFRVGALDAAALPLPIILTMAESGLQFKALGACHLGGSRLVARQKTELKTLRGKLIGVPGLDSNENFVLAQELEREGLRMGIDFKTISVSFDTAINDLKADKVDAFFLPEPYGSLAETSGLGVPVEGQRGRLTGTLGTALIVRGEVFEKRKDDVKEWLESVVRAGRSIEKDLTATSGRQTAIIQQNYFGFLQKNISVILSERRGELKFGYFKISAEEFKKAENKATKMKLLSKSVNYKDIFPAESLLKATQ